MKKERRHDLYKKILRHVTVNGWNRLGFCLYFDSILSGELHSFSVRPYLPSHFRKHFPEIWKRKPKKTWSATYWFKVYGGRDKERERILREAIKETAPKKKKK